MRCGVGDTRAGHTARGGPCTTVATMRYSQEMGSTPLIIRGPGAGAHVTAAGVFADLAKLGAQLGARVPI